MRLISEQQVGFVPGRYIGECIRTTYDTLELAKEHNKTGLLLLIDFEKAFDSISYKYITKMLTFFGFDDYLKKWVEVLLYNFSACINMAVNLTVLFEILRGARQGDPIASPLFVLSIEILCTKLRNSHEVIPYTLGSTDISLSLFADDMSVFLKYCENNLRYASNILSMFFKLSGLKIQLEKTQVIVIGPVPHNYNLCPELELNWQQNFTLLGVVFNPKR